MTDELALSLDQYKQIMDEVWKNHRFARSTADNTKFIKYVRPNWDMRDGMCFSIKFDHKEFHSGHTETTPMYVRIMEWLKSE